jgi:lysophospholipase L1-like esterase
MRRFATALAGPLLAVVVFFVTGELLARQFAIVDRLNGYNRILFAPGPTPRIPYALRPGVRTTQFGIDVQVNALGLRGPEVSPRPAPDVRRVLLLGDSVVFGQGIAGAKLSELLAGELNAKGGDRRWEVLNAGVPGYNLIAEAAALEGTWLALSPHLVIVGVSLNDYDRTPRYSPLNFLTLAEPSPIDRSELLVLLRWLVGRSRGTLLIDKIEEAEHAARELAGGASPIPRNPGLEDLARRLHLDFYHAPQAEGLARLRDGFEALRRITADARLPLLAAIFPERYQVGTPAPDLAPQRALLVLCRETGVHCLDLQPAFAAAGGELFLDAQHPNEAGLEVAARALAETVLTPASGQ